ncbi:glycosyltransferase [Paraflavitalea sp. CAU 1676]|uniref:glycosyltransferase n=1 Tax=Paraflavitalea sp. CAU 1676 TaxID=3032598 RepID=UPI0023DBA3D0|nr:glycosyltransferase [Paraflavitalea sp. CAU 1676]MDF2189659.1 glycosyltransferase [Paraflavitalea sp. CAU 1676]
MDNQPVVSVCAVTYNHESYLAQCLDSLVMQQTNFAFEVIVGEDCSTDSTRKILREYDQKYPGIIKPIYHQRNVGAARNLFEHCLLMAKGKYIAICDGDDYWTDHLKLQRQVDFLEAHPGCVLSFHRVKQVDQHDRFLQQQETTTEIRFYSWEDILHISIPTLSVVFRNCIPHYPDEVYQAKSGDTFLFGMLSRYGGAADLGFIGAAYRVHAGGTFSGKSQVEQYRQTIHTRKLMQRSPFFSREQLVELSKEIERRKKRYMKHFIKKGEFGNCLKILFT